MTTITEFLLDQIARDEALALAALGETTYGAGVHGENAAEEVAEMGRGEGAAVAGYAHLLNWMPARVLAECKAKREIVELHAGGDAWCDHCSADRPGSASDACPTIRALASVYADREGYRAEWAL